MFEISNESIEGQSYRKKLANPRVGGVVTFEGRVRNHNENKSVLSLEYEAYELLAEKEGKEIVNEALAKFDISSAYCVHRQGSLQIGEMAVWVVAAAEHREAAFQACEYIINQVKARVPIWKCEHYENGEKTWVRCDHCAKHSHTHKERPTQQIE